jgi:uncharacterized protein YifN (PemK superfamily)
MIDFGPDPRNVAPPGIMVGPLGVLPEMYKERHGIVIATTSGLTTVVPLSTSVPRTPQNFHYRIVAGKYPGMSTTDDSWIKSDLITTVSNARIDRPFVAGRRTTVILDAADLKAVRATVLHALQMGRLTSAL